MPKSNQGQSRRPPGDPGASSSEYRAEMSRRRQEVSLSLRKQKRDAKLWKRRQSQAPESAPVSSGTLNEKLNKALNEIDDAQAIKDLQNGLAQNSQSTCQFLRTLIESSAQESKCRGLVSRLSQAIHEWKLRPEKEDDATSCFAVLLDLSYVSSSPMQSSDSYYGRMPLRWSDLIIDDQFLLENMFMLLGSSSSSISIIERVCNILGNLIQDAPRLLPRVLPAWELIVGRLPTSTYLCANIVRHEGTTPCSILLRHMTPAVVLELLGRDQTLVEAAWTLEGLSRREFEGLQIICEWPGFVESLVRCLVHHQTAASMASLTPLLRSFCNISWAGDGWFLPSFLSQPDFLRAVRTILEQNVVLDVVELVESLLTWDLEHPRNGFQIREQLVPPLTRLVSPDASYPWKKESIRALRCATGVGFFNDLREGRPIIQWIWHNLLIEKRDFVAALLDLLMLKEAALTLNALVVADQFLRLQSESQQIFKSQGGILKLEDVCELGGQGGLWEKAAEVAADILDDLFAEEDEELNGHHSLVPQQTNTSFIFGLDANTSPPAAFQFGSQSQGRGRGKTLPSWMQ